MYYNFSENLKNVKPSAIREIFKFLSKPGIISFAAGNPSPDSFPIEHMNAVSEKIFKECPYEAFQYGTTEGYLPLRDKIKNRLIRMKNSFSENDEVIITTGGQQGIDLCARALLNKGDTVICESPSFIGALNSFRVCGANIVGVETQDDGMCPDALEKAISLNPNTKIIYLIPTFHNPTGITTSIEKRKAIYEIAKKNNIIILEDDPYGDLRFSGSDVATVKSLDTDGVVVYCSSFSKIISSGIRVGFLCGPKEFIDRCIVIKQANDVHTNLFYQMLISKYLDEYDIDAHINGIKELYGNKCTLMVDRLIKGLDETVCVTRPEGGLFTWVTLPKGDSTELFELCISNGVAVVDGKTFLPVESSCSSVRLNYSTPSDEQILRGVDIFCSTVNEYIKR